MVSRAQRETTKSTICIPISPRLLDYPRRWVEVLYFRNEAVLGLPVSTTSYSRHAVSTVQSPISTADNDRSLIDTDGAKTPRNPVLLPYLYIINILRPVSNFHSFPHFIPYLNYWSIKIIIHLASNRQLLDFYNIISLASDKKSLGFYRVLLSMAWLSSYIC